MGTFLHVLSEQYRTEHFFVAERSVLTEHLYPMFPRTLTYRAHLFLIFANCPSNKSLSMMPLRVRTKDNRDSSLLDLKIKQE